MNYFERITRVEKAIKKLGIKRNLTHAERAEIAKAMQELLDRYNDAVT